MQQIIFKYNIPTYTVIVNTTMPATGDRSVSIAQLLPTQIGRIYGLSTYTDTVTQDNKQLISINDAMNLYINLVWGSSNFFTCRMDSLIYDQAQFTTSLLPGERYLPVNIPYDFALDQSSYLNPTGIITKSVSLVMWYISKVSYNWLVKNNIIEGDLIPK